MLYQLSYAGTQTAIPESSWRCKRDGLLGVKIASSDVLAENNWGWTGGRLCRIQGNQLPTGP